MVEIKQNLPPFLKGKTSAAKRTWGRIAALIPVAGLALAGYKGYAAPLLLTTISVCVLTEIFARWLLGKKPFSVEGGSVLTGLLLAFFLPPSIPLWMAALGGFFAVLTARELYGGLAQNLFNPAAAGHVFLLTAFPITMNQFVQPFSYEEAVPPILYAKQNMELAYDWSQYMIRSHSGWLGAGSAAAVLISGFLLVWNRLIYAEAPVIFLFALAAVTAAFDMPVLIHVFNGGTMLAAFFLVTDPVTTPHSRKACRIYAFLCGLILALVRKFSVYADGTTVVLLLMNALTPWIDQLFRPERAYSLRSSNPGVM